MVKLMLDGFGGDRRQRRNRPPSAGALGLECYHVNAQLSKTLENIGEIQSIKLLRLFLFCLEAIWCRFRYGVDNFYYVPAPGKRVALYRDWLVMLLCRPFFKNVILHWHAAGPGQMAGNRRADPVARHHLPPVQAGGPQHRAVPV